MLHSCEQEDDAAMWIVGKLRGYSVEPLADLPSSRAATEAEAWARNHLEASPGLELDRGEYLTWQRTGKEVATITG